LSLPKLGKKALGGTVKSGFRLAAAKRFTAFLRLQAEAVLTSYLPGAPCMRRSDIARFVSEVIAAGAPIRALGHDVYLICETEVPDEDMRRVAEEVQAICNKFGPRDHRPPARRNGFAPPQPRALRRLWATALARSIAVAPEREKRPIH
jgi:hypothetical protein